MTQHAAVVGGRQRDVIARQVGGTLEAGVLKWQVEHSPAATCAVPSALSAGRSLVAGVPAQLIPASWQLEQAAELTTLCTIEGVPCRSHC